MRVAIAGGSGFVGAPLVARLAASGHDVVVLSRNPDRVRVGRAAVWDAKSQGAWSEDVARADVVINLAGENIGKGRWTEERKRRLLESRLDATRALVQAMRAEPGNKRTFISASAVGFYGPAGDEVLDESSPRGRGVLSDISARWEEEARGAEDISRLVVLRLGVVLAPEGGALAKMMLPFRFGAGGPVGSGTQWMSWVTREDVLRIVEWAIENENVRGVYNVTSPEPVRNRDFARALGRAMHRPAFMPAPAFALRLAFGEMADEVLLGSQRALPRRAQADGFQFAEADLAAALSKQIRP